MKWNADDLSQRTFDLHLLDQRQLEGAWGETGTRNVEWEVFTDRLLSKSLLTNFQLDKVLKGDREGSFMGTIRCCTWSAPARSPACSAPFTRRPGRWSP